MLPLQRQALRRAVTTRLGRDCLRCNSTSSIPSIPSASRQVIFSGIQPTSIPHLGNYLGALREWVKLQNSTDEQTTRLFSIVDLHAITVKQSPDQLRRWRKEMLASFLAVGLDPSKSILFYQSAVPQHAELMWMLSCNASMGYLSRMTQWKSKMSLPETASPFDIPSSSQSREATKLGLFSYPVLQAADILLYGTTHVPVGEDQAQHLEFTRELGNGFNHALSPRDPVFVLPQTILSPAKRVMSLKDPTKKMSKSDPDPKSRILITDTRQEIEAKIKSALTDSVEGISYDRTTRPGVSNLIDLMCYMEESITLSPEELAVDLKDISMRALKELVAGHIDKNLGDIREKYNEIMAADKKNNFLSEVHEEGRIKAVELATKKLDQVKRVMGLGGWHEN